MCDDLPYKATAGDGFIHVANVEAAVRHAAERGLRVGIEMGRQAGRAESEGEIVAATLDYLISRVEYEAAHNAESEQLIADVTANAVQAAKVAAARIEALEKQVGSDNWLRAVGSAKRNACDEKRRADGLAARLRALEDLAAATTVGAKLHTRGEDLRAKLGSGAVGDLETALKVELDEPTPEDAVDVDLSERRVRQLTEHLERQLFASGAGEIGRTRHLLAALSKRPAMRRLLEKDSEKTAKLQRTMTAMIESAAGVLGHLTTGKRGTRTIADHQRFESILAALTPDDAKESHMMRTIEQLLGIHHEQIERALQRRQRANEYDGDTGGFSNATMVEREQRKDYRALGRRIAVDFWHKATRLDTRLGKKKRHRETDKKTGEVFYREHWRHVQYDTDEQIADEFFQSVDYAQYVAEGGQPFGKSVFFECKCFCIDKSDFQECACPTCTVMRENVRGWHRQRAKWHARQECACGACAKGSPFRQASGSLTELRKFVHAPCGKASFPELAIQKGPKQTDTVTLYRRQCCGAPLDGGCPHCPPGSKNGCVQCEGCTRCGWDKTMPCCPIECSDEADAEWKEYKPRVEADGA